MRGERSFVQLFPHRKAANERVAGAKGPRPRVRDAFHKFPLKLHVPEVACSGVMGTAAKGDCEETRAE